MAEVFDYEAISLLGYPSASRVAAKTDRIGAKDLCRSESKKDFFKRQFTST